MILTRREVFDQVKAHLLKQGHRSYSRVQGCVYRGKDGDMCAVGCLIPDDIYDMNMEGTDALGLFSDWDYEMEQCSLDQDEHGALLMALQAIHDQMDPEKWPAALDACELDYLGEISPCSNDSSEKPGT